MYIETFPDTFEVRCVVAKAKPRPTFDWYLDDVLLENVNATDFKDGDADYQSLVLKPEDSNKRLRCVINHISLEEPQEASIILNFNDKLGHLVGLVLLAILGPISYNFFHRH